MTAAGESGVPTPPPSASVVFGEHLPLVERYAHLLASEGVRRGLLGPREVPRLWDRHLLNCGVLADLIPVSASACDVGSGAGLPGVVLAIVRPDLEVTLLEPLLRRVAFLSEVVETLGLDTTTVVRARAEEHDGQYDVVTARAVAPLGRLARVAVGLCKPGGSVLAVKGERAGAEVESARRDLAAAGVAHTLIERIGEGLVSPPTTVVRLLAGTPASTTRRKPKRR